MEALCLVFLFVANRLSVAFLPPGTNASQFQGPKLASLHPHLTDLFAGMLVAKCGGALDVLERNFENENTGFVTTGGRHVVRCGNARLAVSLG